MDNDEKLNVPNLQVLGQDTSPVFAGAKGEKGAGDLPTGLAHHPAYSQVFQKGKLTFERPG